MQLLSLGFFIYKMGVPTITMSDCVRMKWVCAERLANGGYYQNYHLYWMTGFYSLCDV